MADVSLEFIDQKLDRLLAEMTGVRGEMRSVRDDMQVMMSILLRNSQLQINLTQEFHSLEAKVFGMDLRLRKLETESG